MKFLGILIVSIGCFVALSLCYLMVLDQAVGAAATKHAQHYGQGIALYLALLFTYSGIRSKKIASRLSALIIGGIVCFSLWSMIETTGEGIGLIAGTVAAFFISSLSLLPGYAIYCITIPTRQQELQTPEHGTQINAIQVKDKLEDNRIVMEQLLQEADAAYNKNDFASAKTMYTQIVEMDAPCEDTDYARGRLRDIEDITNR